MATMLEKCVAKQAFLTEPKKIHCCHGSGEEARSLIAAEAKEENIGGVPVFKEINQNKWLNFYYYKSHIKDVSEIETIAFIYHFDKEIVEFNNNCMDLKEKPSSLISKFFDFNLVGLKFNEKEWKKLFYFDKDDWKEDTVEIEKIFSQYEKKCQLKFWNNQAN